MKGIEERLDWLHSKVKEIKLLHYFTAFNRVVLAVSFIPSGMTKLLGNRFTLLSTQSPVGMFFESFYQSGFWYRFVGFAQVLAAVLLLIPRTSTLGAVIFFPIVLNIMLITWSLNFTGTWVITTGMFLANLYLICWDYDKFKPILPFATKEKAKFSWRKAWPLIVLWAIGGTLAFIFFAMINHSFASLGVFGVIGGLVGGAFLGWLNALQMNE